MYSQSLVNDVIPNEHIYMTNGVTQAVQIITSYLSSGYLTKNNRPITALYIEELTYFLIKMHLEDIKIPVKTFSFNKLDQLKNQMDLHKNFNEEVAFYIIPFCHNPTGLTLKEHTINNFLNIIDDSIVLSDETYLFLSYGQTQYKSLYFYQKSNIIAMHTFSKIMAPGLRLGYILCKNKDIIEKLNNSGFMESGGSVNPLMAYMVKNILENTDSNKKYLSYLEFMKNDLGKKMKFILSQFDLYKDILSYEEPEGGYFVFFKLPKMTYEKVLELADLSKLNFHIGPKFGINFHGSDSNVYLRLSVSFYSYEDLTTYFPKRFEKFIGLIKSELGIISKTKVWILGHNGRLGTLIKSQLDNNSEFSKLYTYEGIDRNFSDLNQLNEINPVSDVIIDVSSPEGTTNLLTYLLHTQNFPRIIIGTTGNLPIDLIKTYSVNTSVILSSNFSEGIQSILDCLKSFDIEDWDISISETHHTKKKDSPSGTALTLKNTILSNFTENLSNQSLIPITSSRIDDVIGYHEIKFTSATETITISHNVLDRNVFAIGCIKLIENIKKLNNGLYYNK